MAARVAALASAIGLLALLASCVSPAEVRRRDEATCASYGFKPGTDAFAACLQQENLARQYILQEPFWGPHHFWR
jgi:hypothetical protein